MNSFFTAEYGVKVTQQCAKNIITKIIVFSTESVLKTPLGETHRVTGLYHALASIACF